MSYQVIARKYRPQRFSDVVGQEHVTQTLSNAIAQKRIAHAYLFVGPRGTGKTTIARIFAKCLNCTDGPKAEFDDNDPRCIEITEGRSMDVLEIDGASNRGIDEIRELRDTVRYAPASSRFKVYIIDEVHSLTKDAFNALLKTLEEPPAHVKFMFATTEPEKVLPTILSRCQRFDLRRIPTRQIVSHLAKIAKLEGVTLDDAALYAIARGADGGMRDAESALDQLISFCGNNVAEADVLSMFGLTAQSQILSLARAVIQGSVEAAIREFDSLASQGKDLGRLLADLLNHFRNLLVFQISSGDTGLIEAAETELAALKEEKDTLNVESLARIMEVLTDCEIRLRGAASRKILIEVALVKAIQARNAVSLDVVLGQLNQLRGEAGASVASSPPWSPAPVAAPVPANRPSLNLAAEVAQQIAAAAAPAPKPVAPVRETPAPAPAPTPSAPAAATPAIVGGDLFALWTKLLDAVAKASSFAHSYLVEAHPVSFEKSLFVIGYDPEFSEHLSLVDHARNHTLLQTKLGELGHPQSQFKFIQSARPAQMPKPVKEKVSSGGAKKDDFKNDPLIQKALEIFKGQIVEVR